MRRALGGALIALPLVGVAVFEVITVGVMLTLATFALAAAIIGSVVVGTNLWMGKG